MAVLKAVLKRVKEEPVMTMYLVQTGVAMAVGFGLSWTGDQVALFVTFTGALLSFIVRSKVSPVGNA